LIVPTASEAAGVTTVAGYVFAMGNAIEGAIVKFQLAHDGPLISGNVIYMPVPLMAETNSDGLFTINVPYSSFTTRSGDSVFYKVEIRWADNVIKDDHSRFKGVRVPDSEATLYLHNLYGW